MRNRFSLLVLLVVQIAFSQNFGFENKKTEDLIRIWGVLKYQHPEVSKGTFNFDEEFVNEFKVMERIMSEGQWNEELIRWIRKFDSGKIKFRSDSNYFNKKNIFSKNVNFEWIENSGFNPQLVFLLSEIKNNVSYKNYYASTNVMTHSVNFKNDKAFEGFASQNKSHRMLFLASFWNKMNYWNVNVYLAKTPWNKVLTELIPDFEKNDAVKFELAKEKLFSKLNDSHANYSYSYTLNRLVNFPSFGGRIINDSLVVTSIYDEVNAKSDNISIGDVIFSVDKKSLRDHYILKFSDVISVSNENYLRRAIEKSYLLASERDSVYVSFLKKNGKVYGKLISLKKLNYYAERYVRMKAEKQVNFKMLSNEVGYMNLDYIEEKDLKIAFDQFKNTKGIVIDLRNYPHAISGSVLANYLYPKKKEFLKVLAPMFPSYGEYSARALLSVIKNPFVVGSDNKEYYKGKIVLLVDRSTASYAEFIAMVIQQSPNCYTMGEQTFGAVMNRNEILLTDKTKIDFTSMGAFYSTDEGVQGKGVMIDCEIKESAKNFNKNLYLDEAIKWIQK